MSEHSGKIPDVATGVDVLAFKTKQQRVLEGERAKAEEVLLDALEKLRSGDYDAVVAVLVSTRRGTFGVMATPFDKPQLVGYLRLLEHKLLVLDEVE